MSTGNCESFMEELRKNPGAKALITKNGVPQSAQEFAETLLSAAKKLGIRTQIDAAELAAYIDASAASRKASTDQAVNDLISLDDDEVEEVAGGKTHGRLNWTIPEHWCECWANDKCWSALWN